VYWTDSSNGTVNVVPKHGGAIVPLATGQASPGNVAVDDTYAYWSNALGGAVMRARKDGSAMPEVVVAAAMPVLACLDSANAYYYSQPNNDPITIYRVAKGGGAAAPVGSLPLEPGGPPVLCDGSTVYAVSPGATLGEAISTLNLATGVVTGPSGEYHSITGWAESGGNLAIATYLEGVNWNSGHYPPKNIAGGLVVLAFAPCGVLWSPGLTLGLSNEEYPIQMMGTAKPVHAIVDEAAVYWTDSSGAVGALPLP
jgi:hypothetical protein